MTLETDAEISRLLTETRRIALVGALAKLERASNRILKFLLKQGYEVIPVNPGLKGQKLHGVDVLESLESISGVINVEAAERAEAWGLEVVTDRCPKIEISRLGLLKEPHGS